MLASREFRNRAPQLLAALSEPDRLAFAADVLRGHDLDALIDAYGDAVARKHLGRLTSCGLATLDNGSISVDFEVFALAIGELQLLRSAARGPATLDRPDINDCFDLGWLSTLPQDTDRRQALLRWITDRYLTDGPWTERGVDLILKTFAKDHATLRRALVDHGYLMRAPDGSRYAAGPSASAASAS